MNHVLDDDGALRDAAASVRAEWRADEEEWARAALERWRHERRVLDLAREHMHRGDTIRTAISPVRFTGTVVGVGDDTITLATSDGRVDIRADASAPLAWHVVRVARDGGTRGNAPGSLRSRLLELESQCRTVEVGVMMSDTPCRGRLSVGRDHVVVHDVGGTDTVVAFAAIAWVRAGSL